MDKKYSWYRFIPLALVMGIIFFLSHQPGDSVDLPDLPHVDKLLHMLVYGVLSIAAFYAVSRRRYLAQPVRVGSQIIFFCFLYGLSDEFHQMFIPDRSVSAVDLLADGAGATLAVILVHYLIKTERIPAHLFPYPQEE